MDFVNKMLNRNKTSLLALIFIKYLWVCCSYQTKPPFYQQLLCPLCYTSIILYIICNLYCIYLFVHATLPPTPNKQSKKTEENKSKNSAHSTKTTTTTKKNIKKKRVGLGGEEER